MQILDVFRSRQSEEHQRYDGLLSLQRGHALVIRKKWRQLKQFLTGPRGAWAHRCVVSLLLLVERLFQSHRVLARLISPLSHVQDQLGAQMEAFELRK